MKIRLNHLMTSLLLTFLIPITLSANIQTDSTGLDGDHFSLEGALELFKQSNSLEEFEKLLNSKDNHVNNLDLNEDGTIDYIRVEDNHEKDVHAIVLQVPVNEKESQDIAVLEIEKTGAENAVLQIIGDEAIYGESQIVEPFETEAKSTGKGPSADLEVTRIVLNVWFWPSVRFIYRPGYRVWVSPWRWNYYPNYWKPWRPRPWRTCYNFRVAYRPHYHVVKTHRVVRAHRVYTPRRKSSKIVHTRTTTRVAVRGKNGKVLHGKKTTRTTKVKTKKGTVTHKTTKAKVGKKGKNGKTLKRKTVRKKKRN